MAKKITIQVWNDVYYCRVIGKWFPDQEEAAPIPAPESPLDEIPTVNDAPFLICLSSMYKPRNEVMGASPVAPGQHPIPKDFMEEQIRNVSYMFANEFGIFQPESKAKAKMFLGKQTNGFKMIKEIEMDVSPATGSMTLKALRDSIDQYTEEEQEKIEVITVGEHPKDADKKNIEKFIHNDKVSKMRQYLSVTKLTPVYEIDNPYVNNSELPQDPSIEALPTGTEEHPISEEIVAGTEEKIAEDITNRETLETFDEMVEPTPVMDEAGEPVLNEDGEQVMEVAEVDRIAALEELLAKKNKQLEEAGIIPPTITKEEELPKPRTKEEGIPPMPGLNPEEGM